MLRTAGFLLNICFIEGRKQGKWKILDILALIVNFNGFELTRQCIESLRSQTTDLLDLMVVDNASTDGSAAEIASELRKPKEHLIVLEQACGYASAVNYGLKWALEAGRYKYVLLLGNDTELNYDMVTEIYSKRSNSTVVGAVQVFADDPNKIYSSGGILNHRAWTCDHYMRNESVERLADMDDVALDYIDFAAVLIPMPIIEDIGLLDERYGFYWEDLDWCKRAQQKGYAMRIAPAAIVRHHVSATANRTPDRKAYFLERNRFESALKFRSRFFVISLWSHEFSNTLVKRYNSEAERRIHRDALCDFALRRKYRRF